MIESRRILDILRLKKTAEATAAGRTSLILGSQRVVYMARETGIAVDEALRLESILSATTYFVPDLNPRLYACEFIERNAAHVEAFMKTDASQLRETCARVASQCRVSLCNCFACGYPDLTQPMYERTNRPSRERCPSCGFAFGVDDKNAGRAYERWRESWLAAGSTWQIGTAPTRWDGRAQLAAFVERRGGRRRDPL